MNNAVDKQSTTNRAKTLRVKTRIELKENIGTPRFLWKRPEKEADKTVFQNRHIFLRKNYRIGNGVFIKA
jgi:hypothetical protein